MYPFVIMYSEDDCMRHAVVMADNIMDALDAFNRFRTDIGASVVPIIAINQLARGDVRAFSS